jgi:hypothetical protein
MTTTPFDATTDGSPGDARRTISTTRTYDRAEALVDRLADEGFPVDGVTIVGSGLRYVERVDRRMTTGGAIATGAVHGTWIGLFVALLFNLFFEVSSGGFIGVLASGIVAGAVSGALWGAVFHLAGGGRRDFASEGHTSADSYEVQVDARLADRARAIVADMPA